MMKHWSNCLKRWQWKRLELHRSSSLMARDKINPTSVPNFQLIRKYLMFSFSTETLKGLNSSVSNLKPDKQRSTREDLQKILPQQDELLRIQNFSFKKLTKQYKQQAIDLIAHEFNVQEPLTNAFFRKFPKKDQIRELDWKDFWRIWINDSCQNSLSVAIHDTNQNNELIGVCLAKDLLFNPEGFADKYLKDLNFISTVIDLQEKLLKDVDPKLQLELTKAHNVVDIWGGAIKSKHLGKKLLIKMFELNELLAKKQGYHFTFGFATNFKSQKCFLKLNYQVISRANAKQVMSFQTHPFELIDQDQKYPSLWLKSID